MFYNTVGGQYKRDKTKKRVFYTFPDNAYCEIDGVKIPLGQLTVQCQGEHLDGATIEHFTKVSSSVASRTPIFNTSLLICDNDISETGYPLRADFEKKGIEYLDSNTYNAWIDEFRLKMPPKDDKRRVQVEKIQTFIKQWASQNRKDLSDKINEIVSKDNIFPKNISIIYDDRHMQHASHVVLSFQSKTTCTLRVDSTVSPTVVLLPADQLDLLSTLKIDIEEYDETTKDLDNHSQIILAKKDKEPIVLGMSGSVDDFFKNRLYARMKDMIQSLGFNVSNVELRHSRHNVKMTAECVPFAVQDKIDYVTGRQTATEEKASQKGIRLRAEQAILSYLVTGEPSIAHYDDNVRRDCHNPVCDPTEWYPNYREVCEKLNTRIKALSFAELRTLYLAQEIDADVQLAFKIRGLILEGLREKLDPQEYSEKAMDACAPEIEAWEAFMAPDLLFVKPTTVYVQNGWPKNEQKMAELEGMLAGLRI